MAFGLGPRCSLTVIDQIENTNKISEIGEFLCMEVILLDSQGNEFLVNLGVYLTQKLQKFEFRGKFQNF